MIRILSRRFLESCQMCERHKRSEGIIFSSSIKIRERHRDIKEHSNNKVIINLVYYNLLFCSREPKVLSPKLNISYTESGVYLIILVAFGTIKNIDQSPNFPINRFVRFCFICQFYEIWIGATCKIPMSFRYVFPPCIASPVKLNVFPNASQLFLMFKNFFPRYLISVGIVYWGFPYQFALLSAVKYKPG